MVESVGADGSIQAIEGNSQTGPPDATPERAATAPSASCA